MPEPRREGTVAGSRLFDSAHGAEADRVLSMVSISPKSEDWMQQGECRRLVIAGVVEADMWYPEHGEWGLEALKICRRCPVKTECLDAVLEMEAESGACYGIAGEKNASQRRRMLTKRGYRKKAYGK